MRWSLEICRRVSIVQGSSSVFQWVVEGSNRCWHSRDWAIQYSTDIIFPEVGGSGSESVSGVIPTEDQLFWAFRFETAASSWIREKIYHVVILRRGAEEQLVSLGWFGPWPLHIFCKHHMVILAFVYSMFHFYFLFFASSSDAYAVFSVSRKALLILIFRIWFSF